MAAIHNNEIPPPADMQRLSEAIGKLVIGWGHAESSMSMLIAVIYHEIGGRSKIGKQLPFVLRDKLAFVRKSLSLIKPLKPYRKKLGPILDKLGRHNAIRVAIIHGYLSGYDPASRHVCFVKLDGGGVIHKVSHLTGTVDDIDKAANQMMTVSWSLAQEMIALAKVFMPLDKMDNASGQVSVKFALLRRLPFGNHLGDLLDKIAGWFCPAKKTKK